jgi:lipoprotein-anchoring transpeptidase ErfK/SrfK
MSQSLLVVNLATEHMYFYYKGRQIWSAPIGEGAPKTPTPPGHFWIREEFVLTNPSNGYYPYAFGTSDYSTLTDWPGGGVVGIHGPYGASWNQIPGRISHGCIRLHVPDDFWLGNHLFIGTPLLVK